MRLQFQRGDIVLGPPTHKAACYCILDIVATRPDYPYSALDLANLGVYQLPDIGLTKIGTATAEFLSGRGSAGSDEASAAAPAIELRFRRGKLRAEREAWQTSGDNQRRWQMLAAANPGDTIGVQLPSGSARPFIFEYVVERGAKYVFIATSPQGESFKLPLSAIDLHAYFVTDPSSESGHAHA